MPSALLTPAPAGSATAFYLRLAGAVALAMRSLAAPHHDALASFMVDMDGARGAAVAAALPGLSLEGELRLALVLRNWPQVGAGPCPALCCAALRCPTCMLACCAGLCLREGVRMRACARARARACVRAREPACVWWCG